MIGASAFSRSASPVTEIYRSSARRETVLVCRGTPAATHHCDLQVGRRGVLYRDLRGVSTPGESPKFNPEVLDYASRTGKSDQPVETMRSFDGSRGLNMPAESPDVVVGTRDRAQQRLPARRILTILLLAGARGRMAVLGRV